VFGLTLDAQRGFLRLRGIYEEPTAGNRLTLAGRFGDNQASSHITQQVAEKASLVCRTG
jgi:hypothetical protein